MPPHITVAHHVPTPSGADSIGRTDELTFDVNHVIASAASEPHKPSRFGSRHSVHLEDLSIKGYHHIHQIGLLLIWGLLTLGVFLFTGRYISGDSAAVLALATFVIVGWAAQPANTSIEYTSLAFLTLITASGTLTWDSAWAGTASESYWLIFCGMSLSAGLTETPVSKRIASLLCSHSPSWCSFLVRLHVVAMLLAMTVPSQVVRVQLVLPIARRVLEYRSVKPYSLEAMGVILSLVVPVNHCGVGVLTGALPNFVSVGALQHCDIDVSWGFWFVRMAPTFGFGSAFVSLAIVLLATKSVAKDINTQHRDADACPEDSLESDKDVTDTNTMGPLSLKEHCVLLIFIASLGFWATDTFHGVRPVTIGLVAVLLMFFPLLGPVSFGVLRGKINLGVLIFVAACTTLAPLLSKAPTVAAAVRKFTSGAVSAVDGIVSRHLVLFALALPIGLLVNGTTPQGILTPQLCNGMGLAESIDPRLGMLTVAAVQNVIVLPYQCGPFLIVASLADDVLSKRHLIAVLVANSFFQVLLLFPLTLAYWSLLGWSTF
jgi:hypothetical protein